MNYIKEKKSNKPKKKESLFDMCGFCMGKERVSKTDSEPQLGDN